MATIRTTRDILGSKLGYDMALRQIAAKTSAAPELGAIENTSETAFGAGEAQSRKELEDKTFAGRLELENKKLAERSRQSDIEMARAKDYLSTWKSQNKWATVIGVGNLALTGMGAIAQTKSLARQEASMARQEALAKEKNEISLAAVARDENRWDWYWRNKAMKEAAPSGYWTPPPAEHGI